jgi:hypothetical protein
MGRLRRFRVRPGTAAKGRKPTFSPRPAWFIFGRGSNVGHTWRRVGAARADEVARRFFQCGALTDRCVGAAARLPESERKDLAILALARSERVSDLAARHRVSRKFVYQQTHKARVALDGAFLSAVPEGEVLFELAVTKTWLNQVIVALPLICHSSYRGVVEFMRDLLGIPISVGAVHHVLQSATRGRTSSTTAKTCQAFASACTMRSSMAQYRYWQASPSSTCEQRC